MSAQASTAPPQAGFGPGRHRVGRWLELLAGVVAMMVIGSVLYAWPLLRAGPGPGLGASLAAVENAFAAFILAETLFVPFEGWLGDRHGRWLLVAAGAALVALGAWAGSRATGVQAQVGWYALGGVGSGLVYGGTVAKVLKRFTDRKALCIGVTAGACLAVAALALGALAVALEMPSGGAVALAVLGGGQAAVVLVASLFILDPGPEEPPPDRA